MSENVVVSFLSIQLTQPKLSYLIIGYLDTSNVV